MIISVKQVLFEVFGYFTIASTNDVMAFTSDKGSANIDIADGTYAADELASVLQAAMNANATLTGTGIITFAVSYGSTTGKYTIDATTGHTIALTYASSDAASTLGYIQNKTAAQTIISDQPVPGNPDSITVVTLHERAEQAMKTAFDREFTSTSYFETYDGTGTCHLYLPQYPITAISYLGTKTEAIKIKNTSTDANNAYVTIDSTNMTLTVSGGTNASTTTLALATYTTLTLLVAAINAAGKGWSAELYDSDYGSYLSANLIPVYNYFVGSWNGVTASYEYLDMLDEPFQGYQVYSEAGYIYYPGGFPAGSKNIAIKYIAGYTTMPADLQGLVMDMVNIAYQQQQQSLTGVKSFRIGQYSVTYGNTVITDSFNLIYDKYHKIRL